MDAITNTAKQGKMPSTTKFDNLKIVAKGLILEQAKKQPREISFTELDKIYIKVYQSKYRHASTLILVTLAFLYIEYAQIDITMFMTIFSVIPFLTKKNYFRRYALIIRLKEDRFYIKNIPLKLKSDTVELINEVKRLARNRTDAKEKFPARNETKNSFFNFPIKDKPLLAIKKGRIDSKIC